MSSCSNNYVPEYVPPDLPWYERDGLMTWYDQAKCEDFLRNSKHHFQNTKIVNFNITRSEAKGEKVPDDIFKKYQTVQGNRVSK